LGGRKGIRPVKNLRGVVGVGPYAKAEGRVFLLVPAYPGCRGTKAVKLLLLLLQITVEERLNAVASVELDTDTGKAQMSTAQTDSLAMLLTQGLLSNDKKMLNVSWNNSSE